MSTLIIGIVTFFLHALVLKLAVGTMGVPQHKNSYSKAMWLSFGLGVAGLVLGILPFFLSWPLYAVLWFGVIMSSYDLGFTKSVGVATIQLVLKAMVGIVMWIIGWYASIGEAFQMGF
ncbi:hypothetical protein FIV42_22420 [Persicimonas caeni]|uniref:Uncharacterized protein n=1 Tax=Persicimonas caeni TaxID=2292766 RepID=A0A4Y6PZG2_PERCE|nr:hypothetical protein [Persicimonas caeni]QDG53397.1 hypothetical protein FIV42_22420 [Persicimonas caeni]QED34618.1 hypothetical protein FRD00_22415 [Persicimonas caeni]